MGQLRLPALLLALPTLALSATGTAAAAKGFYECQRPLRTGVEVHELHGISAVRACPVALELFGWESSSSADQHALYGCRRPKPEAAGHPFLRLDHFRGWKISLRGPDGAFTMSRGERSFAVTGTDFPLDCT
jgi:hypothetical protein